MFFFHEAMDQLKTEIDKGLAYFKHWSSPAKIKAVSQVWLFSATSWTHGRKSSLTEFGSSAQLIEARHETSSVSDPFSSPPWLATVTGKKSSETKWKPKLNGSWMPHFFLNMSVCLHFCFGRPDPREGRPAILKCFFWRNYFIVFTIAWKDFFFGPGLTLWLYCRTRFWAFWIDTYHTCGDDSDDRSSATVPKASQEVPVLWLLSPQIVPAASLVVSANVSVASLAQWVILCTPWLKVCCTFQVPKHVASW